ncbi:MAG TPA: GDSL-type esterase/lipase family protein, partial [Planctomycetota bacterium]|nr:GDSL-type esterase/lipase family protein [Planctomycetota bacterium]
MGSSNTQRVESNGNAQNWVDWVDMGLMWWYGRNHITINSGISGETSSQILARFGTDVELFQPHVVIITCGGNDANPRHGISTEQTKANLREMVARCQKLPDCQPILQTYYSADIAGLEADAGPGNQEGA